MNGLLRDYFPKGTDQRRGEQIGGPGPVERFAGAVVDLSRDAGAGAELARVAFAAAAA
jgi:hypothetical protein